jgi:hypothetical protein
MYKILLSLLFVISAYAELIDGVAIVVKGEAITLYEIQKEMDYNRVDLETASNILIRKKLEKAEIKERKINISNAEVYDEIELLANRNNLNVSDFYEAARKANNLSSTELKEKVKERLLSNKLYSAITYSKIKEPNAEDVLEYFKLHKSYFFHPSGFKVIIYQSKNLKKLKEKIKNPMRYSPNVVSTVKELKYSEISSKLANLLTRTSSGTFSNIIPDGIGGHMSFYVKEVLSMKKDDMLPVVLSNSSIVKEALSMQEVSIEGLEIRIKNMIMKDKREQVLSDYFARIKTDANIKHIRKP